jgi:hypothetical protein
MSAVPRLDPVSRLMSNRLSRLVYESRPPRFLLQCAACFLTLSATERKRLRAIGHIYRLLGGYDGWSFWPRKHH